MKGRRVFDDHATNRRILTEALTRQRMRPALADSGSRALERAGEHALTGERFAWALLDVQMPGMGGFALAGPRITMSPPSCLDGITEQLAIPETPAIPQTEDRPVLPAAVRPLRILPAEDHPVHQKGARRLLEKQGHSAVAVPTGAEAWAAFARRNFDLILMDIGMPVRSGYDATRAMRARERNSGGVDAGMDGYLSKTIRPRDLFEALPAGAARMPARKATHHEAH